MRERVCVPTKEKRLASILHIVGPQGGVASSFTEGETDPAWPYPKEGEAHMGGQELLRGSWTPKDTMQQ